MKSSVDCIPCVFLQALNASRRVVADNEKLVGIQHRIMGLLPALSLDMTPAELSYHVLKETYELLGSKDPYAEDKHQTNETMLALYPKLEKIAEYSKDRIYTSLKLAAAGNTIDLGILSNIDISSMMTRVLEESFGVDDYPDLMEDLKGAKNVLYLADNSGEIVCDKLFISSLGRKDITVAVKSRPILNDATMTDVEQIGLAEVANVIETGSGMLGTILSDCSEEFVSAYNDADLIISKGQANYESLDGANKNIYFILTAKCDMVAASLGTTTGNAVVIKGKAAARNRSAKTTN